MTPSTFRGDIVDALAITAVAILAILALMKAWDAITPFDDRHEIHELGNVAYAVKRGGVIGAQALALTAAVSTYDPNDRLSSLLWLVGESVFIGLALLITGWVLNKVVLRHVSNVQLLGSGDLGIGLFEASFFLAVGLLLGGSLTGTAASIGLTVASSVVFFVLGVLLLLAYWWAYELVARGNNIRKRLTDGHTGAGVEAAGVLIAAGIVIRTGVSGDFTDWGHDIGAFALTSVIGLVIVLFAQFVLNAVGPGRGILAARRDDSVAHQVLLASMLIAIALVTSSTVYVAF